MKFIKLLSLAIALSTVAFAAPEKIVNDGLQIGRSDTGNPKELIFNTGDGASNPKLSVDETTYEASLTGNGLTLGDGTSSNKTLTMDIGGSNPVLRYNAATGKWEFSNDGSVYKSIGSGGAGGIQLLEDNADFDGGIAVSWTQSNPGTVTAAAGANIFRGVTAAFDATAAAETYTSTAYDVLPTDTGHASCFYKTTATDYRLEAWDGSAVVGYIDLQPTSTFQNQELTFSMPASGTIALRTRSQSNAAPIYIDDCFIGLNTAAVQSFASPEIVAVYTTGAAQAIPNGVATVVNYLNKVKDSYDEVTVGASWAFTSKISGDLEVCGSFALDSSAAWGVLERPDFALYKNGVFLRSMSVFWNQASGTLITSGNGCAPATDIVVGDVIDIRIDQNSGSSINLLGSATTNYVSIKRYPANQQVYKIGFPGQERTAFTPNTTFTSNVTWTGWYQCNAGNLTATYNAQFSGATTAASLTANLPSGFTIDSSKIPPIASNTYIGRGLAYDFGVDTYPLTVFHNSTTAVTIKVENAAGTFVSNGANATNTAPMTYGSGDSLNFTYTVPVTASSPCPRAPAPVFKGAVTTTSEGVDNIVRADIVCSGSSSTTKNPGSWISSVGNIASGACNINIAAGVFSSAPECFANMKTALSFTANVTAAPTTSVFNVRAFNTQNDSNAGSFNASIFCVGPR